MACRYSCRYCSTGSIISFLLRIIFWSWFISIISFQLALLCEGLVETFNFKIQKNMLVRLFSLSTLLFFLLVALQGSWMILFFRSSLCLIFIFLESYQGKKELRSFRFWYGTERFLSFGHVITFAQNLSRLLFLLTLSSCLLY